LWYLGHESAGYRDVADRFGITISTLHVILTRVTHFVMQLAPHIIKFPTLQEKEEWHISWKRNSFLESLVSHL